MKDLDVHWYYITCVTSSQQIDKVRACVWPPATQNAAAVQIGFLGSYLDNDMYSIVLTLHVDFIKND